MTIRHVAATVAVLAQALSASVAGQSPMFRGNPAHTGVTKTEGVETLNGIAWRFRTQGAVRSSPALVDGVLYVGSSDGHLYAVRAESGTELWRFDAGSAINSSPAVSGRVVLFMDRANKVWAVDRENGRLVWHLETGPDLPLAWGHEGWDYYSASPVVTIGADGQALAVMGSGDGVVRALRPQTGEVVWRFDGGSRMRGTPAVAGGLAYVGNGAGVFYALDIATGRPSWTFETSGVAYDAAEFGFDRSQIQGSAAVLDGTVYFGSRDASLYALDANSGQLVWHREDGSSWVINAPAVRGDVVINGRSSSAKVRALDPANGDERWVFQADGPVFASPALVGPVTYVASGAGSVYALDVDSGTELWRFRTGGGIYSTPVVSDGKLYVGSDDGHLYALEGGPGPMPLRAVYFDDSLTAMSSWGRSADHQKATEYFEHYGYQRLDGTGLAEFLGARIGDRIPSVVVFGMDALPPAVTDGVAETTLFRRYLAAGGKLVWLGNPPQLITRDSTGKFIGLDRDRAGRFAGVDLSAWDSDEYHSSPTEAGLRWGIKDWRIENPTASADAVDVVLLRTSTGAASAWVKSYGGTTGTGLVLLPAAIDEQRLDEIRRVAEFGVMNNRARVQ